MKLLLAALKNDIAKLLGLSSADYANRKRRGTLRSVIADWAIDNSEVSLDWLLAGEGDPQSKDQGTPPLNSALLKEIIEVVEAVLRKHRLVLDPPDKAEAITVLYEMYMDSGKKPEERTTERMLRLVA